jgi:hypothetical protein
MWLADAAIELLRSTEAAAAWLGAHRQADELLQVARLGAIAVVAATSAWVLTRWLGRHDGRERGGLKEHLWTATGLYAALLVVAAAYVRCDAASCGLANYFQLLWWAVGLGGAVAGNVAAVKGQRRDAVRAA